MKRLLVLNGSHSDVPLIQAGKRLGFRVITSGNDPALIGHRYSDEYHCVDFSDKQGILELARKLKIDAVCACANDFGAISAAFVAQQMGLPGHDPYETATLLHHKDRFKGFALANGITTPDAACFTSPEAAHRALDSLEFPLIVKPVDLTGGKGVSRVDSRAEFTAAVDLAYSSSRLNRFVVEQFIEGTYHSFSTFVVDRKIVFCFSDDEYSFNGPFLVSTSAAPATGIEEVREQLKREAQRIVELLSLKDGVFHIQYVQAGGRAWILEITRRCSGDFYPYPVNYATGLDWAQWIVKAQSGTDCGDFPDVAQRGYFGRHCIMATRKGTIRSIDIAPEIQGNVIDRFMMLGNGDVIADCVADKVGVIFLRYESQEEMTRKTRRMGELVSVEVAW